MAIFLLSFLYFLYSFLLLSFPFLFLSLNNIFPISLPSPNTLSPFFLSFYLSCSYWFVFVIAIIVESLRLIFLFLYFQVYSSYSSILISFLLLFLSLPLFLSPPSPSLTVGSPSSSLSKLSLASLTYPISSLNIMVCNFLSLLPLLVHSIFFLHVLRLQEMELFFNVPIWRCSLFESLLSFVE